VERRRSSQSDHTGPCAARQARRPRAAASEGVSTFTSGAESRRDDPNALSAGRVSAGDARSVSKRIRLPLRPRQANLRTSPRRQASVQASGG
jgi:hypothetical protein